MKRAAVVSPCGRYRYLLGRRWGAGPTVCWVMLNPSTADAEVDDPTIRRCIGFARRWGFGALEVVNLFALRSPHPSDLALADDPVGPETDFTLDLVARDAGLVMAAWGAHPMAVDRGREVAKFLADAGVVLDCLGTTASGAPLHPLARGKSYVPSDVEPVRWVP